MALQYSKTKNILGMKSQKRWLFYNSEAGGVSVCVCARARICACALARVFYTEAYLKLFIQSWLDQEEKFSLYLSFILLKYLILLKEIPIFSHLILGILYLWPH